MYFVFKIIQQLALDFHLQSLFDIIFLNRER